MDFKIKGGFKLYRNGARVSIYARIGSDAEIGNYAKIGSGAEIGSDAKFLFDLGYAEGYRKVLCSVKGTAYIGAGCRWFTLAEARAHWSVMPNRTVTMLLVELAERLAVHYKVK